MITNPQSGTNVHEIADGIYRINTPVAIPGGPDQFNFNQYLIVDDAPLLFHTGPRRLFPLVREAMRKSCRSSACATWLALRSRRMRRAERVACGGTACGNWCGQIAAMVSANDVGDRPARARRWRSPLARQARRALVRHAAPAARLGLWTDDGNVDSHVSAATSSRKVAPGRYRSPNPTSSARARRSARRWITTRTRRIPPRCSSASAREQPTTLACMHGSAFRGDGAALLRALAQSLSARPQLRAAA